MTNHDCRGCKHRPLFGCEFPCVECKRVHRVDHYESEFEKDLKEIAKKIYNTSNQSKIEKEEA